MRSRRRGEALEQAILEAAHQILREDGYSKLTMEGVAAAAGTGKAALYRRWADKDTLVTAVLQSVLPSPQQLRLTGDVREDLLLIMCCIRNAIGLTNGAAFDIVRHEGPGSGGLVHKAVGQRVLDPCRREILAVLTRGIAEGSVRPGTATPLIADVGPGMIIQHVVVVGTDVPEPFVVSVVDEVLLPLIRA
ncbi:TetR/AcrR family transcriptional regulator [Frankia sp. ACN1ag]|uniref:TetR/AcrR family transcriptional regulator n=1 Tax=Frankia sp. ACN1ag TaxID=102891 RepID=UPI0018FE1150|nr:TetR/AcrR family transcriptional regulator [Frankia sp. ACN1ag]